MSTQEPVKTYVSLERWHVTALAFTEAIKKHSQERQFDSILAIGRGGFAIAGYVANHLNIRAVGSVTLGSYDGTAKVSEITEIIPVSDGIVDSPRLLIVDELVDGGHTMRWLREKFPKAFLSVVYAKPNGKKSVDYFQEEIPQEEWIVYPWEAGYKC